MIKKYKPNEVICIVNDEEIESLNPEDVEWLGKKIGTFEELYPEFSKILDDNFIFLITDEEDNEHRED